MHTNIQFNLKNKLFFSCHVNLKLKVLQDEQGRRGQKITGAEVKEQSCRHKGAL